MAVMCVCVCACVCVRGCLVISPGSWTGTFEKLVSTPVQFTYLMILLLVENPGRWWEYVCAVCVCLWGGGGDLAIPLGSWIGTFAKVLSIPVHFTHPVMLLLMADPGRWWWWCVWGIMINEYVNQMSDVFIILCCITV